MNSIKIIFIGILVFLSQTINAQEKEHHTNEWKSNRPDGHAPISVMGDHYHHKGEVMFSYRFMYMNMKGLLQGDNAISNLATHQKGYMVTPLSMPMKMHMLGAMYAPSDKITLIAMVNYIQNDMALQMRMPNGMTRAFSTSSSGLGDIKLGMLYKFINKNKESLHANVGISIPTGELNAKDVTPMSAPNKIQLPYPMQIGSGTYDADLGLTYLGQAETFSWGSQLKGTYRFGKNSYDYSLGNRYSLNSWFAVKTHQWLSFSARLEGLIVSPINGKNPNLNPMMVTTANTENSGGKFINGGLGFSVYAFKGSLKNLRFGFEFSTPLYQNLNGIQLKNKETITAGLQYSL
ncbi:alpha amylase, catalytic subdomain protein [Tenacibaculum holothuriorum]|uniref:Alpha amylase, catalytic subdomain protein n=1 Tax=Tenacibaculum holothuriorum TaxID=1635173 RepID=A0A1Y2PBV0_9FLAO|nr:alpha amylase [Tenacibaculum holothuriorum]OSY87168.1 alpha amylase, catalytic subdomain protein [Tenacibaculum holothuriorum]